MDFIDNVQTFKTWRGYILFIQSYLCKTNTVYSMSNDNIVMNCSFSKHLPTLKYTWKLTINNNVSFRKEFNILNFKEADLNI